MSNETMLSARGVGLRYGLGLRRGPDFWALRDVTFEVFRGETLGVVGANGSGKSSLLRILAGIHVADQGVVENFGNSASLLTLQLGFLPQLSGRDNALLSGMLLGLRRRDVAERMDEIIEFTGLEQFIDRPIATYSSGMRARLGFAVAYMSDPEVLLIDEVLGVGDEDFRAKSTAAMRERISGNKTVVLVSHDHATVTSLCDRAIWLHHGRVVRSGGAEEVVASYLEAYSAGNLLAPAGFAV